MTYYDYDPAYRGSAFENSTYINCPGIHRRYHNLEVRSRQADVANHWQMQASYLATHKNVFSAVVAANSGVPVTPNDEFFPKNETWETTFRASGSYRAPWGITGSSVFEYQSGAPLARTVLFRGLPQLCTLTLRMEPLGAIRLPGVKLLNLRASKQIMLGNQRLTDRRRSLQHAERQRRDRHERGVRAVLREDQRHRPAARGEDRLLLSLLIRARRMRAGDVRTDTPGSR